MLRVNDQLQLLPNETHPKQTALSQHLTSKNYIKSTSISTIEVAHPVIFRMLSVGLFENQVDNGLCVAKSPVEPFAQSSFCCPAILS